MRTLPPRILTIAGSDSGGGAGVQADLKTFAAHDCYGMSVITAITAQNTLGVASVMECSPQIVSDQLAAVLSDIGCDAIKTGMLGTAEIVEVVVNGLIRFGAQNLVVDPVMVSKSGHHLLNPDAVDAVKRRLFPLAALVTPNLEEVRALLGYLPRSVSEMEKAARDLFSTGCGAVLVKGGHLNDPDESTDVLWDGTELHHFRQPRLAAIHTHGTGCTLSSAIAANLGSGLSLPEAVDAAREYLQGAIAHAYPLGSGVGPVNHFWKMEENIDTNFSSRLGGNHG
ncbi:bifunctional hydroxymethylpyrimidine kinase/phosphomethylpyrimidine kinase [soil metagenome]